MQNPLDGINPGWEHLYACLREEVDHRCLQSVLAPQMLLGITSQGAPTWGWSYLLHHLAKLTKALGEACIEAFASLNFRFKIKYDTDTQQTTGSAPASYKSPTDLLRARTSFRTPYSHFLIFDLI